MRADSSARGAVRAGARTAALDGLGHWWMLQDPARERPSCANSGPPWPDPALPVRAGAPAGIRLNLIAVTGHGLRTRRRDMGARPGTGAGTKPGSRRWRDGLRGARARAPGATAGVLSRFRRGQALAIGLGTGRPPGAAAASPASAGGIPRAPRGPETLIVTPLGVGSRSGQVKRHVRAGVGEQPRALTENHRDDKQGHLVDQVVLEQPADQSAAAVHLQLTPRPGLQLAHGSCEVTGQDGRVRPARPGERGRRDVLGLLFSATPIGWARISSVAPQEPANTP